MRSRWSVLCLVLAVLATGATAHAAGGVHRIGGGVHYWRVIDDIDIDDIDESGLAYMVSYQYAPSLLKLELDLEVFPEDFGGASEAVYAPQAVAIIGAGLYAGLGVGVFYFDGDFLDQPFYLLRAGVNLELLPSLILDINANYHFTDFEGIRDVGEEIDTDTVTLGAALRLAL